MSRTLVIGDVHGHIDRLTALVEKAAPEPMDILVQVGDLGNFSADSVDGDEACYRLARNTGMIVLWGNHDRAVVDDAHRFHGFCPPTGPVRGLMEEVAPRMAYHTHDYYITHAGIHANLIGDGPGNVEELMYELWEKYAYDPIGYARGGNSPHGGILWRDDDEPLWPGKQIYGHTSRPRVRKYGHSYCIDVGRKENPGSLAGIWLPECRVVAIGPYANRIEDESNWKGGETK